MSIRNTVRASGLERAKVPHGYYKGVKRRAGSGQKTIVDRDSLRDAIRGTTLHAVTLSVFSLLQGDHRRRRAAVTGHIQPPSGENTEGRHQLDKR